MTTPNDERLRIESELTAYYDFEAADRAERPLGSWRVEARRHFLAELADDPRPLLEVGTGAGRDVSEFVDNGLTVVGVDLSHEQALHARRAGANEVVATARNMPFRDRTFSALWSMSTLMHVPNTAIAETLDEIRRVLAPRSIASIGVWGGPDVEDYGDRSEYKRYRRLFSRRSDETWQRLLKRLGNVQTYETWGQDEKDFWYQWAILRVPA